MKHFLWGLLSLAALWVFVQVVQNPPADAHISFRAENTTTPGSSASSEETGYVSNLPDYGRAPELTNDTWLNVDHPLRLAALRGKVVLLDMWTFECINCIHVIPSVRDWHEKYGDQGLVVIANHFPEFSFEHDIVNLRAAMERLDVPYAVAQDNDGATWNAYNNRYWPTIYLIDKNGHVRYGRIGEGAYDLTEQAIQDLLKESYTPPKEAVTGLSLTSLTPTTDLNVRTEANSDSSVIGSIQPGEAFIVRGEENGWYRIHYNDQEGYVSSEFVRVSSS